jgi:hypothetical protein
MPVNPVVAENSAPTRKKIDRPKRTDSSTAGSTSRIKKISTTKMLTVLNCRRR